jgi:hypothetical protein
MHPYHRRTSASGVPRRAARPENLALALLAAGTAEELRAAARGMRAAVAKGLSREEIVRTVRFTEYQDVRNWYRMNLFVSSYYHLLTKGRPENAYP